MLRGHFDKALAYQVVGLFQHSVGLDAPDRLRLEFWPIERIIPSPRNARTHSDAPQIAEIAGSIQAFGFTTPF